MFCSYQEMYYSVNNMDVIVDNRLKMVQMAMVLVLNLLQDFLKLTGILLENGAEDMLSAVLML